MLLSAFCFLVCGVQAETLRDPFTFGPREGTGGAFSPTLIGVLWDATRPLAIVGEETVGVGDRVADWEIVEIQQDALVIQRGEQREVLTIGHSFPSD